MKERESNIELLRILAMFMVLVIHANFISLPRPLSDELAATPASTIFRYFLESLGIVSIDVFVLISGWFRINTNVKRVLHFIFRILFFRIGGYVACLLLGRATLSWDGILECFAFSRWDWFIKAYGVLFIIAPVLNTFVDNASEKLHRNVVMAFLLFQFSYGWLGGASSFFVNGYGPLSFIGLYLLAQYVRRVSGIERRTPFNNSKYVDLIVFMATVILNTLLSIVYLKVGYSVNKIIYAYSSPIVVLGALSVFLFFTKLEVMQSRIVNWFGASSFAVYLLHSQVDVRRLFTKVILRLDSAFHGISEVGMILLFLIFVFVFSVLVDQLRIRMWNLIWDRWGIKEESCSVAL